MPPDATYSETQLGIPWVIPLAFALGLALLILLFAKRRTIAPAYFTPLLVTVVLFLIGTIGASLMLPVVSVQSTFSSGESEDGEVRATLETGESIVK